MCSNDTLLAINNVAIRVEQRPNAVLRWLAKTTGNIRLLVERSSAEGNNSAEAAPAETETVAEGEFLRVDYVQRKERPRSLVSLSSVPTFNIESDAVDSATSAVKSATPSPTRQLPSSVEVTQVHKCQRSYNAKHFFRHRLRHRQRAVNASKRAPLTRRRKWRTNMPVIKAPSAIYGHAIVRKGVRARVCSRSRSHRAQ